MYTLADYYLVFVFIDAEFLLFYSKYRFSDLKMNTFSLP